MKHFGSSPFRFFLFGLSLVMTLLGHLGAASAAGSSCDKLNPAQTKLANEILQSQHAYDCCDKSLAECLKQKPVCRLVTRLREDICRRVGAGQGRADIERELARRATSMTSTGHSYRIDTSIGTAAGKADAKVTVVAYVCPRCPFCAKLVDQLHKSVSGGRLSGKVKLYARLFPVRNHPGSTEAGLGLLAAEKQGKFWEFLLALYRDFDRFDVNKLAELAASIGLDPEQFKQLTSDPKIREQLVSSKKEGVRNGVESTPTLFINGRKYLGELTIQSLEDVLEEEHDRASGKQRE